MRKTVHIGSMCVMYPVFYVQDQHASMTQDKAHYINGLGTRQPKGTPPKLHAPFSATPERAPNRRTANIGGRQNGRQVRGHRRATSMPRDPVLEPSQTK